MRRLRRDVHTGRLKSGQTESEGTSESSTKLKKFTSSLKRRYINDYSCSALCRRGLQLFCFCVCCLFRLLTPPSSNTCAPMPPSSRTNFTSLQETPCWPFPSITCCASTKPSAAATIIEKRPARFFSYTIDDGTDIKKHLVYRDCKEERNLKILSL